jgi:Uma2 family endonuclease
MIKTVEPSPMPLQNAPLWPLSVAAYRALGEAGLIPKNTELLFGFVYRKMSKSPLHAALVRQLLRLLAKVQLPGCFVSSEQPITCEDYSEPEPDVAVIRGSADDFWHSHPRTAELVIEVCVTSHDYDRSKLPAYALAGVKECWLILGPEKQIEVHRLPVGNKYTGCVAHGPGGKLTSLSVPEFTVELDTLFAR